MRSVVRDPAFDPVRERHVASARNHHERAPPGAARRSDLCGLGVDVEHSERGLASHEVVGCLEREGCEVLGDIATDCDEPLDRR